MADGAAPQRPSFSFTRHAVDRYVERLHNGACAPIRALQDLAALAHRAELVPRPSWHGNTVWSVSEPAMRWIAVIEDGRAIVVTVLDGADEGIESERVEYDALRVRRLLERIPQIGRSEATSPVTPGEGEYRLWVALEMRRLEVERKRLAALRDAMQTPRERLTRARERRTERQVDRDSGRAHALTELQAAVVRRNDLLEAMATRLADVDAEESAGLLEQARRLRSPDAGGCELKGKVNG